MMVYSDNCSGKTHNGTFNSQQEFRYCDAQADNVIKVCKM